MNELGKSDRPIVLGKSPNKARTSAAEEIEGRQQSGQGQMPAAAEGLVRDLELSRLTRKAYCEARTGSIEVPANGIIGRRECFRFDGNRCAPALSGDSEPGG